MHQKRKITIWALIWLVLSLFPLASQSFDPRTFPPRPARVKTAMEVMKLGNLNLADGKYDVEFYLELDYPDIALPRLLEYNNAKKDLLDKLSESQKAEFYRYYRSDPERLIFYLRPHLRPQARLAAYRLLSQSGYFDRHFPFDLVNGDIQKESGSDRYKVTRYDLDPIHHRRMAYWVAALVDTELDFKRFPLDRHDLSIQLQLTDPMPYVQLVPNRDIVVLPDYFRSEYFENEIMEKVNSPNREFLRRFYRSNLDNSYYTLQEEIPAKDRLAVKRILDQAGINTQMAPELGLPGWDLNDGPLRFADIPYLGMNFSFLTFPIQAERNRFTSFMKVVVPLIFMLLISQLALFVGVKDIANRLALVTGTLLAAVMFHLSATSCLPQIGYLTLMDKLFLASYASFMINLLFTVVILRRRETGKSELAEKYYHAAFWVVPPITCLLLLAALIF